MKVLVTGGTGFLGKAVARALAAAGHELRLLARERSDLRGLPEQAEIVRGDTTDLDSLRKAAEGCAAICHLAALVKVWVPERERFDAVNLGGLKNALEAARGAGARLLYTSSFIAVGPTTATPADESQIHPGQGFRNDYERTKALADGIAREAARSQEVVLLYPGVVYGPGDLTDGNLVVKMVTDHLKGRLPGMIGPGDRLWSYSYVDDVAAGHVAALERGTPGQRYFLMGENLGMTGFFETLRSITGAAVPTLHIPYGLASGLGYLLYLWAELTGHPPQFTHGEVGVFREHWAFSSQKAMTELAYRPRPLAEGLASTVAWLREQGAV